MPVKRKPMTEVNFHTQAKGDGFIVIMVIVLVVVITVWEAAILVLL